MRNTGNSSGRYRVQPIKVREKNPFLFFSRKRKGKPKESSHRSAGLRASVIPRPDAESRKYPGRNTHKRHSSGPRIKCGVTCRDSPTPGHSALRRGIQESCVSYSFILLGQREERTKKRRRCYRAEAVAGSTVVGGCGTRLRLRQSSPRSLLPASPLPAR